MLSSELFSAIFKVASVVSNLTLSVHNSLDVYELNIFIKIITNMSNMVPSSKNGRNDRNVKTLR